MDTFSFTPDPVISTPGGLPYANSSSTSTESLFGLPNEYFGDNDFHTSNLLNKLRRNEIELNGKIFLDDQFKKDVESAPKINYVDTTPGATERNNKSGKLSTLLIKQIADKAKQNGVDPYQALGIAMVETNLGRTTTSNSAANPMQFNHPTRMSEIDAAIDHFKTLQEKTGGNTRRALKLYNGTGKSPYPNAGDYPSKVLNYAATLRSNSDIAKLIK